jgi:Na+/H+-dicarboxylate symporter
MTRTLEPLPRSLLRFAQLWLATYMLVGVLAGISLNMKNAPKDPGQLTLLWFYFLSTLAICIVVMLFGGRTPRSRPSRT